MAKNDGIFQFLNVEDADKIIIDRILSTPKRGGTRNGVWTPTELAIRDSIILEYICRQGLSRAECARQISARWDVNIATAGRYIVDAFKRLTADDEQFKIDARKKHLERLENLLQECLEGNQRDQAIKVLDSIAKVEGLYTEKKEVNITSEDITFKFGE